MRPACLGELFRMSASRGAGCCLVQPGVSVRSPRVFLRGAVLWQREMGCKSRLPERALGCGGGVEARSLWPETGRQMGRHAERRWRAAMGHRGSVVERRARRSLPAVGSKRGWSWAHSVAVG